MNARPGGRVRRWGPIALIVVMLAVAIRLDLAFLGSDPVTVAQPRVPLLVLVGCWASFELVVLYLSFGKNLDHAVHLTVTEIALALGLLFATPTDLILAGVGTPVLIDLVRRRKSLLKQVFNGASRALGIGVALSLYQSLVPADPLSSSGWLVLCLAVTASGLLSAFLGASVISLATGRLPLDDIVRHSLWATTLSLWGATLSFVGGLALQVGDVALAPLIASLGALLLMMRGYSLLTERHLSLSSLHALGQRLASARDRDSILTAALDTSADLLVARDAEVYLRTADDSQLFRFRRHPDGGIEQTPACYDEVPSERGVLPDRETIVAAAPLAATGEVVLSVNSRASSLRPFAQVDARLLDMVAHQTGANLRTAHLIEQLRHDALHDPLTDLPNRRCLLDKVHDDLEHNQPVALVWLGISDVRAVNAALGHIRGDELLVQVGRRLQAQGDLGAVVARVGGHEFVVLLPGHQDAASASASTAALLSTLTQPFVLSRAQVLVRAAAGVALEPAGSTATAEDLLRRADIAMRFAQDTGRTFEHYTAELETSSSEHLALAVDLQAGIARGELVLYAQPQVRLTDDTVTGVEMLVRWNHPRHGLLSPDSFISLAEQTGLDRPMTAWVIDAGLSALAGWRAAGLKLNVSVNVSASALLDGWLRDLIGELLTRHDVSGEHLVVEVTESVLLTNTTMAAEVLHALSDLGVRVSIDDFGTGFSSLSHLRRLPVDEIKVDKSFVSTMLQDDDDAAIVRSVLSLGKDLGLACVAEGIEDEFVYAALQRLGCDSAQGFHMAPPMPVGQVAAWMQSPATLTWPRPPQLKGLVG